MIKNKAVERKGLFENFMAPRRRDKINIDSQPQQLGYIICVRLYHPKSALLFNSMGWRLMKMVFILFRCNNLKCAQYNFPKSKFPEQY